MIIPGTNQGDDLTLLNTLFIRGEYEKDKQSRNILTIIYKNNTTGQILKEEIEGPDFEYYMIKDEYATDYIQLCVPMDQADVIHVRDDQLLLDIAKRTGNKDFFYDNIRSRNSRANLELHKLPNILGSDVNIEDQYRARFSREYTNRIIPITKCFLDIEADTEHMKGDFPEMGECPVNAVTVVFENEKKVYTLLLETADNPQIPEFKEYVKSGKINDELREFVREKVGGKERSEFFGTEDLEYNFLFYKEEEEINLIYDVFRLINMYKPNFVLAWNMGFDIPYLIARIDRLGYNPTDIMCHPDFKHKKVEYYIDERSINEYAERGDFAIISSYSVYLDQMIQFASRRKGRAAYPSFGLDYIGGVVAKVQKVDYKHITTDISKFPKLNYRLFVIYNIFDTIVQKCIEKVAQDIEYVFAKCNSNNTRYSKCHRQTIYLANRGAKEFWSQGFYMGNNKNKNSTPPKTKYPGAFVADPSKLNDYSKLRLHGHPINVFDNLDDFDYKSLYPSILREFNMAPNTQIGMVHIDKKIHDKENRCKDDKYSRAGQFMEDLQSNVWLEFAYRWFHLADYASLYDDVIHYFRNIEMSNRGICRYTPDGLDNAIEFFGENVAYKPIQVQRNEGELINCIQFFQPVPYNKMKEFRENATYRPNQQFTSN